MITLHHIWHSLTTPFSFSEKEEETRREHMTRVIFIMVSSGLAIMSIIIPVFDFSVGEPEYTGTLLILVADGLVFAGWFLIYRGGWFISRYLLLAVFLALGGYFIFMAGMITTGVLQLAIAVILTALLFGDKAQWVTVIFSEALYLALGWLSGERDFEVFFTGGIVVGFSLSGIALLQWYSSTLLKVSIEKLRQAERTARSSEEKIRAIFESINDGITITDLQGSITELNQAAINLHGFEHREELKGHSAFELIAKQDHPAAMENMQLTLSHGTSGLLVYKLLKKSGKEFDGELNAVLIKDEAGNPAGFVALTRDITPRKQAEAEREALIRKLEEKNTELENFTYTVSHDLKAPLITVGGFLGYLEEDVRAGDAEKVKQDIERINDAIKKMNRLLDELLELSRIGRLMNPPENIPFEEIVQEALEKVQGRLSGGKIRVKVGSGFPTVIGDRIRLVEVVQNLLDNAAKFMGEQSKPRIEIGQQGEEYGKPIFFVKDNGIGIAPEYHELIFGLFQRLDPGTKGTGIGLAIVKRIVEFHGGRIWVESEGIGKGTTMCFTLPQKGN
jgi:PAS domain S-box-containing protein